MEVVGESDAHIAPHACTVGGQEHARSSICASGGYARLLLLQMELLACSTGTIPSHLSSKLERLKTAGIKECRFDSEIGKKNHKSLQKGYSSLGKVENMRKKLKYCFLPPPLASKDTVYNLNLSLIWER